MNERLQRLTPSADRPNRLLQIAPDGAHRARGALSAIIRSEPDRKAARHGAVRTRCSRNDFPPRGGKERITCRTAVKALHSSRRRNELTPKTTESHWSGGQREP
jgi:hypothetical protein